MEKIILDATCGGRSIWFDKEEPHTLYCDIREGEYSVEYGKDGRFVQKIEIRPDVLCDFSNMPFADESFRLVVFDPPHAQGVKESSWMFKKYGVLPDNWEQLIKRGVDECLRVLKPYGVLVFKWSDVSISTKQIIDAIGRSPLFGHRSGRKMGTHWLTFMKFPAQED